MIENSFEVGAELDPRGTDSHNSSGRALQASIELNKIAKLFFSNIGLPNTAISILIYAWNRFAEIQLSENIRIYRAAIAMWLTMFYIQLGDDGAAFRWALLTHADDALGEHFSGGAGYNTLRTRFGLREELLENLNQIARENLGRTNEKWASKSAFAEDVALRTILQEPDLANTLSLPTNVSEYPISTAYFQALLKRVNTSNNAVKGEALEELASYLFSLIPGWIPRRNVIDEYRTFETDLVVRNYRRQTDLSSELFGRHFLVECKNWDDAVSVQHVGYFLYRMHLVHAEFGVMFTMNGITKKDNGAAFSIRSKAFHEDGMTCIVIEKSDLEEIAFGKVTFWSLLIRKLENTRFGTSRHENVVEL